MGSSLPQWEKDLIDEAIVEAERRLEAEASRAHSRAVQLAREQGYHRLAMAIDRPTRSKVGAGQLRLFETQPTLFDPSA